MTRVSLVRLLIAVLGMSALGCSPAPQPPVNPAPGAGAGGYDGATKSMGSMVASPNRCAFSFIYDGFVTEASKDKKDVQKPNVRDAVLRGPSHIANAPVKMFVRGAFFGDAGPVGTVSLQYGDATTKVDLMSDGSPGDHPIESELAARATTGDNVIRIQVTLADRAKDKAQQRVDIDSMDVSVDGEFCKSLPAK